MSAYHFSGMKNPSDWVGITEAARILGVTPSCVRQWEGRGILPRAARHPLNRYRRWPREVIESLSARMAPIEGAKADQEPTR